MNRPRAQVDRTISRIRSHPVVVSLIALGTLAIALSTFTNAARNLWQLLPQWSRFDIDGEWQAEVTYDWPNAVYTEVFAFQVNGNEVVGTASFLGTKRGVLDGKLSGNTLTFDTATREAVGDRQDKGAIHHYRGSISGEEIQFVMQTVGGDSEHIPVRFTAKRVPHN